MEDVADLSKEVEKKLNIKPPTNQGPTLYIFGGQKQTARGLRDVDKLALNDTGSPTWKHLFTMEKPRSYFSACEIKGKIYILGGRDGNARQLSSVYEFSPEEMKWVLLPVTLAFPRSEFGVAVMGSKIYSVGGFGVEASESIEFVDVEKLKVGRINSKLSPARWGHGVVAYKDSIYAIGGQWYATPRVSGCRYHHSVQCYNIYSQKWTSCPGMLRRRGYHGVALFEDNQDAFIYAFGGVGGELGNHRFSRLDCVERFNINSPDIWTLITCMPAPLSNFGITAKTDTVYIIGGIETLRDLPPPPTNEAAPQKNEPSETVSHVHEYNFRDKTWTAAPPLIFARRTLCALVYQNNSTNEP